VTVLDLDACRCVGRTGYASDDRLCPLRTLCLRHTDIPEDHSRLVWAMHLCKPDEPFEYFIGSRIRDTAQSM
jgi:hypothetical protein